MERSGSTTAATAENPALDDDERVARLALLAERLGTREGVTLPGP
ncbi:MAG: hypothetical protein ACR2NB_12170 [Solirubrobacteraceae bacterium]